MLSQARIIVRKFVRTHITSSCAASEKSIFKMNYHIEKAKQEKEKSEEKSCEEKNVSKFSVFEKKNTKFILKLR